MHVRTAQHEIGTLRTRRRAVEQNSNVRTRRMFATHVQTMTYRRQTARVALLTQLDTALHLGTHLVVHLLLLILP
ncbi:hypothetical protein QPK87_22580 [Kamptonema cortianum]|nr:hypothetical protein [Kamptonema cortianum]MDL5054982.1 hypothetical protein [Oscillatoria laete-virens NRMC-F 0139]